MINQKRVPIAVWLAGGALVILAGWVFNSIVQANARHVATVAARVANQKVNVARDKVEEDSWAAQVAACGRGNLIRLAIKNNSLGTKELALQLARSRRIAATLEVGGDHAALALHDLDVARGYVKLANKQTYLPQVACAKLFPEPHPELAQRLP